MIPQYLIQHINKRLIWFVASQKEKVKIKNQNWFKFAETKLDQLNYTDRYLN